MARFLSPWKNSVSVVMFIVTRSLEVFEIGSFARKYRNCIYFWIFWLMEGVWDIKCDKFKARGLKESNMRDSYLHCVVMLFIVPKCLLNRYSQELLFVFDLMSFL